jgi:hypothetical protein
MQRRRSQNRRQRHQTPAETKRWEPIAEIPAQTAFLNPTGNYAFRRDWMVETEEIETGCPPCSHRTRLKRESGTGISDAETDGQNSLFRLAETGTETRVESKSPRSVGQMHGIWRSSIPMDWVVVCAVICEPVSIANPCYQGILGEYCEFSHLQRPCKPHENRWKKPILRDFLLKNSRENLPRARETLHHLQGSTEAPRHRKRQLTHDSFAGGFRQFANVTVGFLAGARTLSHRPAALGRSDIPLQPPPLPLRRAPAYAVN